MLFNTLDFFIFLSVVAPVFYLIPKNFRILFLLLASSYFYMYFVPIYILTMLALIAIDFTTALLLQRPQIEKSILKRWGLFSFSLTSTLSVLVYFKYFTSLAIPFGLSFHTFQGLGYIFEVFKKRIQPEKSFQKYSLFVLFFPQLVAGPIETPQNLLPQLDLQKNFRWDNVYQTVPLIIWGLFKKVVIAERLGLFVKTVYTQVPVSTAPELFLAVTFFSVQVYCDFSGYTDIARGVAKLFGVELSLNFNFPYFAKSLNEFWRKFHMSLTNWFRSYLYKPLIERHSSVYGHLMALAVVFIISGFWHGSQWTYVVCALIHGLICMIEYLLKKNDFIMRLIAKGDQNWLFNCVQRIYVFVAYSAGTLFFCAPDVKTGLLIYHRLFQKNLWQIGSIKEVHLVLTCLILIGFLFLSEWIIMNKAKWESRLSGDFLFFAKTTVLIFLLLATLALSPLQPNTFIYFQF